jgi:hypothetical protein
MPKIPALVLSAPILLALASALYLSGQTSTGVIVGSVTDPSRAIGNGGRYPVVGPGIDNWDFSAFKTLHLLPEDRLNLQFRAEFFNGWNHTQFVGPDTWNIPAANFGVITEAARPREIKLGLRLTF